MVRAKSKYIIDEIGDNNYFLLVELIITAMCTGICESIEEFVGLLKKQIERNNTREKSDLEQYVFDALALDGRLLPMIPQITLQTLLKTGVNEGSLDYQQIKPNFVKQVMQRLGYKRVKSKWCLM
jgi:hypothetical protein